MDTGEARLKLSKLLGEKSAGGLGSGYGFDLATVIVERGSQEAECDALFRTLVLDEAVSVDNALELYLAATALRND